MRSIARPLLTVTLSALTLAGALAAEEQAKNDERRLGWSDTAELSLLATGGNSEAQSLALRNTLERLWESATFTLTAAALRAETTTLSRVAVGTPGSFAVRETSTSALTAENYLLRGRYDRKVSPRLFWLAGLGWERNEFAGVRNRANASAGVGNLWFEDAEARFRTDYSVTFTDEESVAGVSDSYAGLRLSYDYWRKLTPTTKFASQLAVDGNVDDTADLRADLVNSLSVAMSDRLALKVSLQLLYDGQPALGAVPLVDAAGEPTGETVFVELEKLDSAFTASLVANF